jgi:hypothetical protein
MLHRNIVCGGFIDEKLIVNIDEVTIKEEPLIIVIG